MLARSTMKVLYVLVSSESDYYYEQALLSVLSLKNVMPTSQISMLVDDVTDKNLVGNRSKIKEYIDEYKVVDLDESMSPMIRSRFLKTSMRNLIDGDFLYVDVDTVWAEPYDETDFTDDIMGVPDAHCELGEHPCKELILDTLDKLNYNTNVLWYINGGVMFIRDNSYTRGFFARWHDFWLETCKKDVFIDQPSLNQVNYACNLAIKLLPDSYNSQIGRSIGKLAKARIIHYFSSWENDKKFRPSYKFLQKDFLKKVRTNYLDKEVVYYLENPKEAFDSNTFIIGDEMAMFWQSKTWNDLVLLQQSNKSEDVRLYKILIKMLKYVPKAYYKIIPYLYPFYRCFKKEK